LPLLKEPSAGSPWLQPRLVAVIPVPDYDSRDTSTES
jgi:anti-sigma factor RsiW